MKGWAMLARSKDRWALDNEDWSEYVADPKHDGMRAMIHKDEVGVVRVYSRSGKEYAAHVPHLVHFAEKIFPNDTMVDGELAHVKDVVDVLGTLVPVVDFNRTMRVMGSGAERAVALQSERPGQLRFLMFDLVRFNGVDLSKLPYSARYDWLSNTPFESGMYVLNAPIDVPVSRYAEAYDRLVEAGVEGLIMKNREATYDWGGRPNRSWFKIKVERTYEVVVTGFTDGRGKYEGQIGAIQFGAYDQDGELRRVGQCSGMTDEERRAWTEQRNSGQWENHQWVIEVKSNDMVGSGEYRTPRHPQYVCLRYDKSPIDCTMEQFRG